MMLEAGVYPASLASRTIAQFGGTFPALEEFHTAHSGDARPSASKERFGWKLGANRLRWIKRRTLIPRKRCLFLPCELDGLGRTSDMTG